MLLLLVLVLTLSAVMLVLPGSVASKVLVLADVGVVGEAVYGVSGGVASVGISLAVLRRGIAPKQERI